MLVDKGRLKLDHDVGLRVEQAVALPRVVMLGLTPQVAVAAVRLPSSFQGDPADWMIVATARQHGVPLVTKDEPIRKSGLVVIIC
jgi:PIN domain nuclease of toxin-antitoxin system